MIALFSDIRFGHAEGQDRIFVHPCRACRLRHGRCALLPRVIGHGRASELLYTGVS